MPILFRPDPRLRSQVAAIEVIESDEPNARVLPSSGAVLGFQFRGSVRAGNDQLAPAGVTGIQRTARTYSYAPGTCSVLVRFTPLGAACLGVPASDLAGRSVPLDDLVGQTRVAEARERLDAARDSASRVAVVQQFLIGLPYTHDSLVARAVALLDSTDEEVRVSAVARALGLSERQLERRFRARVGVLPKPFATLRRFERVVAMAASAPSLTAAAIDAGYYDQSHFIRDFRRFAGEAPGPALRRRG